MKFHSIYPAIHPEIQQYIEGKDQLLVRRKVRLLMSLRKSGIRDISTLRAIESVPRECFVPPVLLDQAYENRTLPIDCGQTLSAPDVVALMTESLSLKSSMRVLEVGTGSGYQAAILGKLVARVYTVERWELLAKRAANRLNSLGLNNVLCAHGDGYLGWPSEAPFDAILIAAGCEKVPASLFNQLADGACLVAPVGERGAQSLMLYQRQGEKLMARQLGAAAFLPLLEGKEDMTPYTREGKKGPDVGK